MADNKQDFLTLFRDPPASFRGAPFWAWNCRVDADAVKEHIGYFDEMGFGGFHIHVRTGMAVPYLQEEYMALVRQSIDEAKARGMYAYLYDEDRWPSGAAGGYATQDCKNRQRLLEFTPDDRADDRPQDEAVVAGAPFFLAAYRVTLAADGTLAGYARVPRDTDGDDVWYAFCVAEEESPWFNNQTYLDTMSPAAVDAFIRDTH